MDYTGKPIDHSTIKPPPLPHTKNFLKNWKIISVSIFVIVFFTSLLCARFFIVQPYQVNAGSMKPTLLPGDHFLVDMTYTIKEIKNGDIIIFISPLDENKVFIKRVIGLSGEKVEIRDKELIINDISIEEEYTIYSTKKFHEKSNNFGPIIVPEESLFMLGDNRDNSLDSRYWGFIHYNKVRGKAFRIYWSQDPETHVIRWDRIGKIITN